MAGFIPKDMRGRIFNNEIDKRNARQPDYTGNCNIAGQVFRISSWHNPPSERNRVGSFSLVFKDQDEYELEKRNKDQDTAKAQPGGKAPDPQHDFDDDIPF